MQQEQNATPGIYIGTSNVVVPGNKTTFPPAFQNGTRLNYYASLLNSVEVNSSFYKIPLLSTYEKWVQTVPAGFKFSLKLSRDVTHVKNLTGDLAVVEKFMAAAAGVGDKKGAVLIQFPGKITLDYYKHVQTILEEIKWIDTASDWKIAVEFRHTSWHSAETWELLDEFGAGMVLHDLPKGKISEVHGHADFIYLRFHGPAGDYRGSYPDNFLIQQADTISNWQQQGKQVFVYFNNTIGSAFENARRLQEILGISFSKLKSKK